MAKKICPGTADSVDFSRELHQQRFCSLLAMNNFRSSVADTHMRTFRVVEQNGTFQAFLTYFDCRDSHFIKPLVFLYPFGTLWHLQAGLHSVSYHYLAISENTLRICRIDIVQESSEQNAYNDTSKTRKNCSV